MVDWPIFLIGMFAVSIVAAATRAISREDQAAREASMLRAPVEIPPDGRAMQ